MSTSIHTHNSLQDFQIHLSERLAQSQVNLPTEQAATRLSLTVNGYNLFVCLTEINTLLTPTTITKLPLAKPWIVGLMVEQSEVLTVFDIAYCLDHLLTNTVLSNWNLTTNPKTHPSTSSTKQLDTKCIVITDTVAPQLAFLADKVLGTVIPNQTGYQLLAKTMSSTTEGGFVHQIWQDREGNHCIDISLSALLQSQAFNQLTY
jgi:chemotaxis signal transduction protein